MVENLPCNAGDVGSVPGRVTRNPQALVARVQQAQVPQLESPHAVTTEPT